MTFNLKPFFYPSSIAVIGASRKKGSLGRMLIEKLINYGFEGAIYPVNPKAKSIIGIPVIPDIIQLPNDIDLAVIQVPKHIVSDSLNQLGKKGIKRAIIITAGFKEIGEEGQKREKELIDIAGKYGIRMIGPNCMGLINTNESIKMNCSFSPTEPYHGNIAFISQSGALGVAVLDMAKEMHLGFSLFASVGNKADLKDVDFMEYCESDEDTDVIVFYMESIEETRDFASAAKRISRKKPIIAIKAGRTKSGAKAASSHTGALASTDRVSDSFLRACGIVRAYSVKEMFDLAQALSSQPELKGNNIAVITNAGGPAIMATDAIEENGLQLAKLSNDTQKHLRSFLPEEGSVKNPVDMIASANHDTYSKATESVIKDENVDALIIIIVRPPVDTTPNLIAEKLAILREKYPQKPVVCVVMAQAGKDVNLSLFRKNRLPVYHYPENAAKTLQQMKYYHDLQSVINTSSPTVKIDGDGIAKIFAGARREGRNNLLQKEVFTVLEAMALPVPRWKLAKSSEEAIAFRKKIRKPIVMKVEAALIQHKSDIGAVKVNLEIDSAIIQSWNEIIDSAHDVTKDIEGMFIQEMIPGGTEIAMGIFNDENYGKMLMLGLGGIFVEVIKDIVFWPASINTEEALYLIEQLKYKKIVEGIRGNIPVHKPWLAEVICKLGALAIQFDEIEEMDINPLSVNHDGQDSFILDGRIRIKS